MWISQLSCFVCEVKIDFVFVCRPTLPGFHVRIVVDLIFVCGPEMKCFLCGDRLTWFVWVVEIDLVFCIRAGNHLAFVRASKLFLCGWSKSTLFRRRASKLA